MKREHPFVLPLIPLLLIALLLAPGCKREAKPAGESDKTTSPSAAAPAPVKAGADPTGADLDGEALFLRFCVSCHQRSELEDREVGDIEDAMAEIPSMKKRLGGRLSRAELLAIARHLSSQPAAAAEPAGTGADKAKEGYRYLTSLACQSCHPDQVAQWRVSLHALAHSEVVYDAYFVRASLDSKQKLETFCAGCHTPLGVHSGEIPFKKAPQKVGDTAVSEAATEGVQCDFCHTVSGHKPFSSAANPDFVGPANASFVLTPGRVKYGPFKESESPFHGTAYSKALSESAYCGTCHNVLHPANGIVLEATFGEWQKSPYAAAGVSCQDCHMTTGLTKRAVRPGKAATTGPKRKHISDHRFIGPNVLFAKGEAGEALKQLSLELMRRAAEVKVGAPRPGKAGLSVPVTVTNVGAGHYLPTGVTEVRQMWLEVTAEDGAGKVCLRAGGLDKKGDLLPGTVVYRTEVHDDKGRDTTLFWRTVKKVRDYRIPPKESVEERVTLSGKPAAGCIPTVIKARLRYRSVSPSGLEEAGLARDAVVIPVLELAEGTRKL